MQNFFCCLHSMHAVIRQLHPHLSAMSTISSHHFTNLFAYIARTHYNVQAYQWQCRVGAALMEAKARRQKCRMLCIQCTGSGKSLLYQTLAAHFRGVTIYILPLLTLGADQVNKLFTKTQHLGLSVIPIHLPGARILK